MNWGKHWLRWPALALILLLAIDFIYLSHLWFTYNPMGQAGSENGSDIPMSRFIVSYLQDKNDTPQLPPLHWQPIPLAAIPERVIRTFIIAEDASFFVHRGFDIPSIRRAIETNLARGRIVFGASTISQQTAKNLFLSPERSWLRKAHETLLTLLLELLLDKRRILEIYLNSVELGQGIFGIEAAASAYWHISAAQLNQSQAVQLAATLPWPQRHNPATRSQTFWRNAQRLAKRAARETYPKQK